MFASLIPAPREATRLTRNGTTIFITLSTLFLPASGKAFSWILAPSAIFQNPFATDLSSTGNIRVIASATMAALRKTDPGEQFVGFIQNHDQIANTSRGKRLASLVSEGEQKLAAVLTLCSPFLPLLFMGEEYGETAPFLLLHQLRRSTSGECGERGTQKGTGIALLRERFRRPASRDHFRAYASWIGQRQRLHPHAEILRLYRDLIVFAKTATPVWETVAKISLKSGLTKKRRHSL